jgi:hypothetical protein
MLGLLFLCFGFFTRGKEKNQKQTNPHHASLRQQKPKLQTGGRLDAEEAAGMDVIWLENGCTAVGKACPASIDALNCRCWKGVSLAEAIIPATCRAGEHVQHRDNGNLCLARGLPWLGSRLSWWAALWGAFANVTVTKKPSLIFNQPLIVAKDTHAIRSACF